MGHGFNSYVTNYQRVNHGLNHGKSHESLSEATASLYLTDPDDSSRENPWEISELHGSVECQPHPWFQTTKRCVYMRDTHVPFSEKPDP